MAMTKSRRKVYNKGWYGREIKIDKRKRRRELNKRVRRCKDVSNGNDYRKITKHFNTIS